MFFRTRGIGLLTSGLACLCLILPLGAGESPSKSAAPPTPSSVPGGLDGARGSYEDIVKGLRHSEFQEVEPTEEPAPLTLEQLRRGQLAWREALHDLQVDFTYTLDRKLKTAADLRREREGGLVPANLSFTLSFAFKAAKQYNKYETLRTEKEKDLVTYINAFNGDHSRSYEPHRAVGQIHPGRRDGMENNADWYFELISIPVGPTAEKRKQTGLYVPKALELADEYRVLPKLEKVDGFLCHVVFGGWDTIWIDHQHGFCVRRRVIFGRTGPNDAGCLDSLAVCKDMVEADKGIWLPRSCVRLDYTTQVDPESIRGKLASVHKVVVSNLVVNHVPDSLFEIEFPPGTEVHDLINNRAYYVPKGEALLEKAIAQATPIVDGKVFPPPHALEEPRSSRVIWLVNGSVALLIACLLLVQYLRRSRTSRLGRSAS